MLLDAGADINAMVSLCAALTQVSQHHNILHLPSVQPLTFPMVLFFLYNQDIKSGQSPLVHAVESNNADMVHFLIEVIMVCGQGRRRGEKGCDSTLFKKSDFLFPAHICILSFPFFFTYFIDKTFKELEQKYSKFNLSELSRRVVHGQNYLFSFLNLAL